MPELPPVALAAVPDGSDLYTWTRDYGSYGTVDLVMPPGPPGEWPLDSTDETEPGRWRARILDLHVL